MAPKFKKLILKTTIFILSLSFAWWLIKSGYLEALAEVVAGIFYTSFLTSPIAVAMLIVLARENNPIMTAFLAGAGAVLANI